MTPEFEDLCNCVGSRMTIRDAHASNLLEGVGVLCQRLEDYPEDVLSDKAGYDRLMIHLLSACAALPKQWARMLLGHSFEALEVAHATMQIPFDRNAEFARLCTAACIQLKHAAVATALEISPAPNERPHIDQ